MGPAPINYTIPNPGSGFPTDSGRISALATDPVDPLTYYAAAAGGGVWKTTNGGTTWKALTDQQSTLSMGSIAVAPSNGQIIYAGTGEANESGDSFYGRGVLKSTDGGTTWSLLGNAQFDRLAISSIAINPTNPNNVYLTTAPAANGVFQNLGVWKTTDGGVTWTNTTTSLGTAVNAFDAVVMDPTNSQVLYTAIEEYSALTPKGVYKSTDGGATWALAGNFTQAANVSRTSLAISQTNHNELIASVSDYNTGNVLGVYKTLDAGVTWTKLTVPEFQNGQGWYNNYAIIDPTNANTMFLCGCINYNTSSNLVLESTDGGTTWKDVTTGTDGKRPHTDAHAMAFTAGNKLLLGSDGGVWRLANATPGQQLWNNLNTNLGITQFTGIALNYSNADIAYGGSQDNGTEKFNDALGWTQIRAGDGGFVAVDQSNPNTIYHEYYGISLERSNDGGVTWSSAISGINTSDSSNFYVPYILDPANQSHLYLGTTNVYESTNRGASWTAISRANTNGWTTSNAIDCLATAPSASGTVYACAGNTIFVTTNDGATWTNRSITGINDSMLDIKVDPTNALIAYAVRGSFNGSSGTGHVFMTTNGGVTWTNISGSGATGLPDVPTNAIVLDSTNPQRTIYVGNDIGVYASKDQGATWTRFKTGLPNAQVVSLDFAPGLQILAAGTHGRGLWEISTAVTYAKVTPPTGLIEGTPGNNVTVATIVDPVGTGLTASITWGDGATTPGTVVSDGGGNYHVTGTHTYAEAGSYSMTVSFRDVQNNSGTDTATVNVAEAPINATPGAPISITEGTPLINVLVANFVDTDPGGVISDYTASIDWNDGTITAGTIVPDGVGGYNVLGSHTYSGGSYSITVSISETAILATVTVPVAVIDAPLTLISSPINITAVEGVAWTGQVAIFHDADPNAVASLYSSSLINWGDGTTSGATFTALGNGNFSVTATHAFAEETTTPLNVSVVIQDSGGSSTSVTDTATVSDAPLTQGPKIVAQAIEGVVFTGTLITFTDADIFGNVLDYTATVHWGDGAVTAGTLIALGSGVFGVGGNHAYAEEGTGFAISVLVSDAGGATLTATTTLDVSDAPLIAGTPITVTGTEGASFTKTVATFTDTDPNGTAADYSALISWGDGSTSAGTIITLVGGGFGVVGTHTYLEEGQGRVIGVTITDKGSASVIASGLANIADAPLIPGAGLNLSIAKGQNFTTRVATFTDADPNGTVSDYTSSIAWGDGTSSPGTVVAISGGFAVIGTHTYANTSSGRSIVTSINDSGGASTTATSLIVVTTPLVINATEGLDSSFIVANFLVANPDTAVPSDYTATILWGDGTTTAGVISKVAGSQFAGSQFAVSGNHPYAEESLKQSVTVQIRDLVKVISTASSTAVVADAPLSAGNPITVSAVEGVTFSGQVATFADTDQFGTTSDYVALITWDDSSTSFGSIVALQSGGFGVTGTHRFTEEGNNLACTIKVTDSGGASVVVTGLANVTDAPLTPGSPVKASGVEGQTFIGLVSQFTDADTSGVVSDYTATIDWGDGTTSAGTISKLGTGFGVNGTHSYAEEGVYSITSSITDIGGAPTIQATGTVTMADAPIVATGLPVQTTEYSPFAGTVATFTDGSTSPDITDFAAMINWGDGVTSAGVIIASGSQFLVQGSHTYQESTNGTITVSVTDKGGAHDVTSAIVTVADLVVPVTGRLVAPLLNMSTVSTPLFQGTSEPNSIVDVFAQGATGGSVKLGIATTDANGVWTFQVPSKMTDGSYTITADAKDFYGNSSSPLVTIIPTMTVDTSAPRVININYSQNGNQLVILFQDSGAGLNVAQLGNVGNYILTTSGQRPVTIPLSVTSVTTTYLSSSIEQATVTLTLGKHSRLGKAMFTIHAAGISDTSGNLLDGEFKDFLPSGNGTPGGDTVAKLDFVKRTADPVVNTPVAKPAKPAKAPVHPAGPLASKPTAVARPKFVTLAFHKK